ncbi:MAG: type II toxin-antitoxin system RelE/ParE family toxin [Candidatus Marinimicrobia bacterium]|jgi:mRNA interferase RelE/StbE|nr:type II toxin-antitoxin system RelE/ParE family toxin [Candidatus Neomarinimicrobiota bacterium]MCK9560113.1 type II toxin-antitoxin system RelE/ParE family toxin [Candidatus Neomarinimicrobiota bacterium]
MASCKIQWDSRALKELRKLPRENAVRILKAVSSLGDDPLSGMPLKGAFQNFRKLRVGDFRVIYSFLKDVAIIQILRVAHRREVYRS